jgi:c-di-GMP-binding flagellar brake protein YcgR
MGSTERERRKFMRIDAELETDYWVKGASTASGKARIFDFCREGIGIHFPKPVRRGEQVDLTLKVPGDNIPIFATAEVSWTEGEPSKSLAGLKFLNIKPLDLARLLDFVYARWIGGFRKGQQGS